MTIQSIPSGTKESPQGHIPSGLPQLRIVRGQGGYCWDAAGHRYVDYICGYGPVILGHAYEAVNRAVAEQLDRGILFAAHHDQIERLSARLTALYPGTAVCRYLKTGSEAVAVALRLARAWTGRTKIVRCGFHGWHDAMVTPYISWHIYEVDCQSPEPVAGLPPNPGYVVTWDGQALDCLEALLVRDSQEIAALILDPVQLHEPLAEHLRAIRALTQRYGVLLILDESKTGFRVGLSGVQGRYGVWADIVILGKAIANGFPLAVVLAPEWAESLARAAKLKGTYNTELASIAAALATIDALERPGVLQRLEATGCRMIDGLNAVLEQCGLVDHIRAVPYRWPAMPYLWFRSASDLAQSLKLTFYAQLTMAGHLLLPDHMNYLMVAHNPGDIDETIAVVRRILNGLIYR